MSGNVLQRMGGYRGGVVWMAKEKDGVATYCRRMGGYWLRSGLGGYTAKEENGISAHRVRCLRQLLGSNPDIPQKS
jgi:hypothetical protein